MFSLWGKLMELTINGEPREFREGLSVSGVIEQLTMTAGRIAVELNHEILAREEWPRTILKTGDRLEIVHFIGGG